MASGAYMAKLARSLLLVVACLGLLTLFPLAHAQGEDFDFFAMAGSTTPVDVASGVQQIHLAQGKDPTTMVISWLTPKSSLPAPASQVRYGLAPDALTSEVDNHDASTYTIPAGYAKPPAKSPYPTYTSGWLHNVELTGLQPDTLYFYQVGDFSLPPLVSNINYPYTPPEGRSGTLYFRTLPAPGQVTHKNKEPLRVGVVADIGQGLDAQRSILRLSQAQTDLIIFAGDEGYADCEGDKWDKFFTLLTGVTSFV